MTFDFFKKTKKVLSRPRDFFSKVKAEKGIKNAYIFYLVCVLLPSILAVFLMVEKNVITSISTIAYPFVGFFIASGLIYFFARRFGGKGSFQDTCKAYGYSAAPQLLAFVFGIIITLIILFSVILPTTSKILLIFVLVFSFAFTIYGFIILIKGLSVFHKFSIGNAVAAAILPSIVMVLVIMPFFPLIMRMDVQTISKLEAFGGATLLDTLGDRIMAEIPPPSPEEIEQREKEIEEMKKMSEWMQKAAEEKIAKAKANCTIQHNFSIDKGLSCLNENNILHLKIKPAAEKAPQYTKIQVCTPFLQDCDYYSFNVSQIDFSINVIGKPFQDEIYLRVDSFLSDNFETRCHYETLKEIRRC